MIRKYLNTVANHRDMLEAGEKPVEYMDICHDNFVSLIPLAAQRLMGPVGWFVAKHHLMLQLRHRVSFFGTPSWNATWRDEGDNRDLKRVMRNFHQRFFEG